MVKKTSNIMYRADGSRIDIRNDKAEVKDIANLAERRKEREFEGLRKEVETLQRKLEEVGKLGGGGGQVIMTEKEEKKFRREMGWTNDGWEKSFNSLTDELATAVAERDTLRTSLDFLRAGGVEARVQSLTSDLNAAKNQVVDMTSSISLLKEERGAYLSQLNQFEASGVDTGLRAKHREREKEEVGSGGRMDKMERKIGWLETQRDDLQGKRRGVEVKIKSLENEVKNIEDELSRAKAQSRRLNNSTEALSAEILQNEHTKGLLEDQILKFRARVNNLEREANTPRPPSLANPNDTASDYYHLYAKLVSHLNLTTKEANKIINPPRELNALLDSAAGQKSVLVALKGALQAVQDEKIKRQLAEKNLAGFRSMGQRLKEREAAQVAIMSVPELMDETVFDIHGSMALGMRFEVLRAQGDEKKERERRKEEVEQLERRIAAFEAAAERPLSRSSVAPSSVAAPSTHATNGSHHHTLIKTLSKQVGEQNSVIAQLRDEQTSLLLQLAGV